MNTNTIHIIIAKEADGTWHNVGVLDSLAQAVALVKILNLRRDARTYAHETWRIGEVMAEYKP